MEAHWRQGNLENFSKGQAGLKPISARIVGGLGNQLFGYFAGRYLAEKLNTRLILDDSQLVHNQHSNSTIFDFELEDCTVSADQKKLRLSQIIDRIPPRSAFLDHLYSRYLGIHYSRQIGFDPTLQEVKYGATLIGYFQSYRYFYETSYFTKDKKLSLLNPGQWFLEMENEIKLAKPIVIHVRRGDYSKAINREFGLLNRDYFMNGIDTLRSRADLASSNVWVFSDSPEEVKSEFGQTGKDFRFIAQEPSSSAAENLLLMSKGKAIVTSNSTFSYWSALLSAHKNVIAPTKWFQSREDPLDLIPPTWTQLESTWQ
jgi:hypothetical protein